MRLLASDSRFITIAGTLFVWEWVCIFYSSIGMVLSFFQSNIFLGFPRDILLALCGFDAVAETDWDSVQRRRLDGANSLLIRLIQNIGYLLFFVLFCFVP